MQCDSIVTCLSMKCFGGRLFPVEHTLRKPTMGGALLDLGGSLYDTPSAMIDYSSPWHDDFVKNREEISVNLHILHPSMQTVLRMCRESLGPLLLIHCKSIR